MTDVPTAIKRLLNIVKQLQQTFPKKRFTLDGRLVGDLGEILAEQYYCLKLFKNLEKFHDGETSNGRKVQIKATMVNSLTFPVDHIPDYYLGIKILTDGQIIEVFNGPGRMIHKLIKNRKPTKNNLHSITISTLKNLNDSVPKGERIRKRPQHRRRKK